MISTTKLQKAQPMDIDSEPGTASNTPVIKTLKSPGKKSKDMLKKWSCADITPLRKYGNTPKLVNKSFPEDWDCKYDMLA